MGTLFNWNPLVMAFSGCWGGFNIDGWRNRLFGLDSSECSGRGHGGWLGCMFYRNALITIFSRDWGCFLAK